MVRCFFTLKQEDFDSAEFHCKFVSESDPRTNSKLVQEFSRSNFVDLDAKMKELHPDTAASLDFSLDKFAAQSVLNDNKSGYTALM